MDLQDLFSDLATEQVEDAALEGLDEEVALFDLDEAHPSSPSPSSEGDSKLGEKQQEDPKEIVLSPEGIAFFRSNTFTLYKEDTLLWPVQDSLDPFLSLIDGSIVNEYIKNGYFMREVSSISVLAKYLFHIMCCTADKSLRRSACDSLIYLLTTCNSMPYIKQELCLVLVNLGGDMSNLWEDVLHYKSRVIPPPSCASPEDEASQMTDSQLREVLVVLLRFLSQWLIRYKNYTAKDVDDLLLIFLIIGLDPKVIDNALDADIGACITHTLKLYSSDKEFFQRMRNIVKWLLEYCSGDLPSVVYLCQAYLSPTGRGRKMRGVLAFHQLCQHLRLSKESFVADVQARDIADLLTSYFQISPDLTVAYDSYYIIKLVDLSLHLDLVQQDQKDDLKTICDLAEQKFHRSQGSADDMNPTISFQCLVATLSRWSSCYTRLASLDE
ncbi:hypothetical protein O3P69_009091 [Scylla paramamosain]|uniref:Uncharacterized protein n=1 Tax=Scylla paramamosain TaxID=85552 RepID=A0AAW0TU95_SCYPA